MRARKTIQLKDVSGVGTLIYVYWRKPDGRRVSIGNYYFVRRVIETFIANRGANRKGVLGVLDALTAFNQAYFQHIKEFLLTYKPRQLRQFLIQIEQDKQRFNQRREEFREHIDSFFDDNTI